MCICVYEAELLLMVLTLSSSTNFVFLDYDHGAGRGKEPVGLIWVTTSWETLDWKKHKLETRLPGEISITSDMQMTPPLWQKVKRNSKASWWKWGGEWKSWLKAQHSEDEDHGIRSHHFMANRWGNSGNSVRLYFCGLQNHCRWWLQPWN